MDINEAWGQALRNERTIKNISQEALAHDAGISRNYMSLLELGRKSPTLNTIRALSRTLNIPSSKLLDDAEEILRNHEENANGIR